MDKKILIVDDQESIRQTLQDILEKKGYSVELCSTGKEALEKSHDEYFSMALLDIHLSDMDGLELLQQIRMIQPEAAYIMITGDARLETVVHALNCGASAFIEKPVVMDNLLAKIKESFQKQDLQKQLVQSEKMASIGQLAAGVAHEINNPIGFIKSNLNTLEEYRKDLMELIRLYRQLLMQPDSKPAEDKENGKPDLVGQIKQLSEKMDLDFVLEDFQHLVQESIEGADRVSKIISDLKDFVHSDKEAEEYADINRGIESTLTIVNNELKYKADVFTDLGEIPLIRCLPQRLNQVFMNLLVNAGHAIEEKGEIRIQTRRVGDCIEIRVSDTGCGIPDEIKNKIFDPFFTTKEIGKGTGIGLNLSYNIVQKHRGTITVDSEVGKGSTFIIQLPVNDTKDDL